MSKRVFLSLIILGVFVSACSKKVGSPDDNIKIRENDKIQWEDIGYDRTVVYRSILEEYEQAVKDEDYTEEKWKNIYDCVIGDKYFFETTIYYSIEDITNDGTAELIIGVGNEDKCYPYIIYSYEDRIISKSCIAEKDSMTIYEGGIVELVSGGAKTYYMYYQLQKNSREAEYLLSICWNWRENEYYMEKSNYEKEITEEEFQIIRNKYVGIPLKMDWKLLDGFWKPDDSVS